MNLPFSRHVTTVAVAEQKHTQSISMTHSSNSSDYASFKCQFACNGNSGCVSFFGRFVNVNTDEESFECLNFKTM